MFRFETYQFLLYMTRLLHLDFHFSSSNAKKWEIELQTLKNNNARLTAALQESTANVDEWKKQLAGYKEETGRLKKKVTLGVLTTLCVFGSIILYIKCLFLTFG